MLDSSQYIPQTRLEIINIFPKLCIFLNKESPLSSEETPYEKYRISPLFQHPDSKFPSNSDGQIANNFSSNNKRKKRIISQITLIQNAV